MVQRCLTASKLLHVAQDTLRSSPCGCQYCPCHFRAQAAGETVALCKRLSKESRLECIMAAPGVSFSRGKHNEDGAKV